jgi:hypothetical protein
VNDGQPMLSKWWMTKSAQDAIKRAHQKRNDGLNELKRRVAKRRADLQKEVNEWSEQP